MSQSPKKKYITIEESYYRKMLRDTQRIEKLKKLIWEANGILKNTKGIDPSRIKT